MAIDDRISIGLDFEFGDAQAKLNELKTTFEGLKESIKDAPNATNVFNQSIDRTMDLIELMNNKLNKAQSGKTEDNEDFRRQILSGISEISTIKELFSKGGSFGGDLAHGLFDGLSEAVKHELDANTHAIANMIKTRMHSLKASTLSGMSHEIMDSMDAQEIFKNFKATDSKTFQRYIQTMLPRVVPTYMFDDYAKIRYGTTSMGSRTSRPIDLMPASFRASYQNGSYINMAEAANSRSYLQSSQRTAIREMIAENDAALRAAEATRGMIKYRNNGQASLAYDITAGMYDEFRKNLFNDFVRRASGADSRRIDMFSGDLGADEQRRLVGRMTSSSAGRVLRAMQQLDDLQSGDMWTAAKHGSGYQTLANVAKRSLEQYEVNKYKFSDLFSGADKHSRISITESPNTRMLGLQGHHNEFTDKVLLISADGYDEKSQAHQNFLQQLVGRKPITIPGTGKQYIMQNMHGTGEHAVLRMVEAAEYERIRKQEEAWAEANGFGKGRNFWNDFVRDDYDFKDITALRKHYDATGKGWSSSAAVHSNFVEKALAASPFTLAGRSDLAAKKIGVIDLSQIGDQGVKEKLADGLAWLADGIIPERDFQARMGVAGKGTLHGLSGYKTLGEWALATGLANKDGRFILPGPRGDVDLTDYVGMADISTVKNMEAYENFKTATELNAAYSKVLARYGLSSMTSYEDAQTRAKGLGAQAMAYMYLSPQMQNEQIKEYNRRMRLLDTEEGIKQYLLGDPNSFLGEQIRSGRMTVRDQAVQSWVQAEKESLINRIASGEWIDFGEQPSVINQALNKSPIASVLQLKNVAGKSRGEILQGIREAYKTKTGQDIGLTDEDLEGVFTLNKGQLIDFARPDEENVSIIRSPSGFGNFVSGKNYAKLAKQIYKDFGLSTTGVYMSEADMNTIGSADYDGDKVKTLYGDIGNAVKETIAIQEGMTKLLGDIVDPNVKKVELPASLKDYMDSDMHRALYFGASAKAAMAMGSASEAGTRATQYDLRNPLNRDLLIATIQGGIAYDKATAGLKNAEEVEATEEMKSSLYSNPQWYKLPSRYSRFFNTKGTDGVDIPDENDVITIDNGGRKTDINLAELRDIGIDKINMRSIYNNAHVGGLRAAMIQAQGGVDMTRANALLQALDQNIGYGDAGEQTKALMQNMRMLKIHDIMNPGKLLSEAQVDDLSAMIAAARKEIKQQAYELSQGRPITMEDGSEMSYKSYVAKKMNEYGVSAAQAFIDRGIHMRNLRLLYGDKAQEMLPEAFMDNVGHNVELPNHAKEIQFQQANVQEQQAIVDAKNEEIKQIQAEIQTRKDRIDTLEQESNKDETIVKEQNALDKEIIAERSRLEEERKQKTAQYVSEMNNSWLYANQSEGFSMPSEEEIKSDIENARRRVEQSKQELNNALERRNSYVEDEDTPVSSSTILDIDIKQAQKNLDKAEKALQSHQEFYDTYYAPVTSNKLRDLEERRAKLGKTEEQIQEEDAVNDLQKRLAEIQTQRDNAAQQIKDTYTMISANEQYNSIMGRVEDVSNGLYSNIRRKEQQLADAPQGELYYNKQFMRAFAATKELAQFKDTEEFNALTPDQKQTMMELLQGKQNLMSMVEQDFADTTELKAKQIAESFSKTNRRKAGSVSAMELLFEGYDDKIATVQSFRDKLAENIATKSYTPEEAAKYKNNLVQADKFLDEAKKEANTLKINELTSALDKINNTVINNPFEKMQAGAKAASEEVTGLVDLLKKTYKDQGLDDKAIAAKLKPYEGLADKVTQKAIEDRRKQLGMTKETPEQMSQRWLNDRYAVLDVEAEQARQAWLRGNGSYEDYLAKAKSPERDAYALQAKQMKELLIAQQENEYNDFQRSAIGQSLNQTDAITRRLEDMRATAIKKRDAYDATSAEWNKWNALVGSDDAWRQSDFWKQVEANFNSQYDLQNKRQALQYNQLMRRHDQLQRSRFSSGRGFADRILNYRDSMISQRENEKYQIDAMLQAEQSKGEAADPQKIKELTQASQEAKDALRQLNGPMGTAMATAAQFGAIIQRVASRLGRQLFQKALAETKRFIKEFDSSMNEIQAITLKSDEEMQSVRTQTISKAIGLRTSVSNVATTEAALYRQGLSDAEVSKRTDSIIKFATVTKLNVAEATKIITTALQNDLVQSAEQAMDALVALGDSAATTAAEIGKGMQKAAASAKVAGVSYAELTALLTIGTSDTQLSGTQVGTALQTVFTRMRRLSLSGYISDVNGEKTTASDAEAALKAVGIDLWADGAAQGKMRSAYEILSDLAKVWQKLSDAQKSIVTNALAGTRQTNIFSTLMEGMSEDDGETLRKYLGLATDSEGITQSKYEIAMKSLSAAMDTFKSSFDSMVASFTNNGTITDALDFVSGFFQKISDLASTDAGKIEIVLSAVAGGIGAIAIAIAAAKGGWGAVGSLLGAVAGLATTGTLLNWFSSLQGDTRTDEEKRIDQNAKDVQSNKDIIQYRDKQRDNIQKAIDDVKKAGQEYNNIQNSANSDRLTSSLLHLAEVFPSVSDSVKEAIKDLSNWNNVVDDASNKIENLTKGDKLKAIEDSVNTLKKNSAGLYIDQVTSAISPLDKALALEELKNATAINRLDWDYGKEYRYFKYAKGQGQDILEQYINASSPTEQDQYLDEVVKYVYTVFNQHEGKYSKNLLGDIQDLQPSLYYVSLIKQLIDDEAFIDKWLSVNDAMSPDSLINPDSAKYDDAFYRQLKAVIPNIIQQLYSISPEDAYTMFMHQNQNEYGNLLTNTEDAINLLSYNGLNDAEKARLFVDAARSNNLYGQTISHWIQTQPEGNRFLQLVNQQVSPEDIKREYDIYDAAKQIAGMYGIGTSIDEALLNLIDENTLSKISNNGLNNFSIEQKRQLIDAEYGEGIYDYLQEAFDVLLKYGSTKYENLEDFEKAYIPNDLKDTAISLSDKLVELQQEAGYQAQKRMVGLEFAKGMTQDLPYSYFTTEDYNADFLQKVMVNAVAREIEEDKTRNTDQKINYYNENNELDTNKVADYIQKQMKNWVNVPSSLLQFIDENADDNEFAYRLMDNGEVMTDETTGKKLRFTSYDKALDYIAQHGISPEKLVDKDGNKGYQTASKLINAEVEKRRENNKQSKALQRLTGSYEQFTAEQVAEAVLGEDNVGTDLYNKVVSGFKLHGVDFDNNIVQEALFKKYGSLSIENVNSLQDLENMYDSNLLSSELSSLIASDNNLLMSYMQAKNSQGTESEKEYWKQFQNAVMNARPGRSKTSSLMDVIWKELKGENGAEFAKQLRNDEIYKSAYQTFQNYIGDAADEILNGIEDGVSNTDLDKKFSEADIKQRIKETTQFLRGYDEYASAIANILGGTDAERFAAQQSIISNRNSWNDYEQAIARYKSGNARSSDYALIAQNSGLTEVQLRNSNMSAVLTTLVTGQRKDQNDTYQTIFEGLLGGSGLSVEDWKTYKSGTGNVSQLDETTRTKLKSVQDYMKDIGLLVDNNGKVIGSKREQTELSFAATLSKTQQQWAENNQLQNWKRLSEYEGSLKPEDIETWWKTRGYDLQGLNALLGDTTFASLYPLDANAAMNYADKKSKGQTMKFADINEFAMSTLFGEDWKDPTKLAQKGFQKTASETYKELTSGKNGATYQTLFDAMFASLTNGDLMKQYLNGEAVDTQALISSMITQFVGEAAQQYKNASEITSFVSTMRTGTFTEQSNMAMDYIQQIKAMQNAQYYLNQYQNGENIAASKSALASYLGIDEDKLAQMSTDDLQKRIQDRFQDLITDKLFPALAEALGMENLGEDWQTTLSENRDKLNEISPAIGALVDVLIAAVDGAAEQIKGAQDAMGLGEAYGNTINGFAKMSNTSRGFAFLEKYWSDIQSGNATETESLAAAKALGYTEASYSAAMNDPEQRMRIMLQAYSTKYGQNIAWDEFMSQNPAAAYMMDLANRGLISPEDFNSFLTTSFVGSDKTASYYNAEAGALFGPYYQNGRFNVNAEDMDEFYKLFGQLNTSSGSEGAALDEYVQKYSELNKVMDLIAHGNTEQAATALSDLNAEITSDRTKDIINYTQANDNLSTAMGLVSKGGKDAAAGTAMALKNFKQYKDQMIAINKAQGKAGKQLDDQTRGILANFIGNGVSADDIYSMTKEELQEALKGAEDAVNQTFTDDLQAIFNSIKADPQVDLSNIQVDTNGQINMQELVAACQNTSSKVLAQIMAMAGQYGTVTFKVNEQGQMVSVEGVVNTQGNYSGKKGSGGGGGKSAVDKLLEKQKRKQATTEHQLKMVQYQEEYYEGDSQLGNYGNMLEEEQRVRARLQETYKDNLNELIAQMGKTKKETDDWYKLREAILSAEEAIEENSNAMEENKRKIEENRQAILKLHTELEQLVKEEIETRIEEEKAKVQGTADMEQTIIGIIRNRYTEEWDLIKKDIDKKREALEEEKRLIDERLQARKDAEETANDYEEMAELQAQYARVSMDASRTKDAMEIRNKIAELQKKNAWRIADEEAEATKEGLDEQIEAYDKFVQDGDEALEKFLEDANNFSDEVVEVLGKSHDELIQWLQDNDKEYKNSLDNTRQTIIQSWHDTFNQMYGITDLYWEEINQILGSKEDFMEYMKDSTSYRNASEDERKQMEYNWEQMYSSWVKAQDTSATYSHSDEFLDGLGTSAKSSKSNGSTNPQKPGNTDTTADVGAMPGVVTGALAGAEEMSLIVQIANRATLIKNAVSDTFNSVTSALSSLFNTPKYAEGGYVDQTGLVWVDGTKSRPEAFLDADDTVMIRRLLNAFDYISAPAMSWYDSTSTTKDASNSIGEIVVQINDATINTEEDIAVLAEKLGTEFARELEKQGFSTANYNF